MHSGIGMDGEGVGPGPTRARIHLYSTQDKSASGNRRYSSCQEFIVDNPDQGLRLLTADECKSLSLSRGAYYWCKFCGCANPVRGGTAKWMIQHIQKSSRHRKLAMEHKGECE